MSGGIHCGERMSTGPYREAPGRHSGSHDARCTMRKPRCQGGWCYEGWHQNYHQ